MCMVVVAVTVVSVGHRRSIASVLVKYCSVVRVDSAGFSGPTIGICVWDK